MKSAGNERLNCRAFRCAAVLIIGVIMLSCTPAPPKQEPETLSPGSPNKRRLMNYLTDEYGKRIISGQMDTSWTTNAVMDMVDRVHADTGKYPALKGFDFIQLPYDGGGEQTREAIEWWNGLNNGEALLPDKPEIHGIVSFCWHWKIGPKAEFYTKQTDFRIPWKDGKLDSASENFKYITEDLEKVSIQLQRFKDLDIPVLWRPLHEASGGWFWWGASGPEPCKALWDYIYNYLAVVKGMDNLIWVWNGQNAAWFPSDPGTVDIVGFDLYPGPKNFGSQKDKFNETRSMAPGGNLLTALSENGAIPDPGECLKDGAMWSWFMTWNDGYGSVQGQTHENNFWTGEFHNTQAHKEKVYNHEAVITLDKLPDLTAYRLDGEEMNALDALSYFRQEGLTVGWNLGNALDAHINGRSGETLWGNPRINRQLFTGLKKAGFNIVRIPITWMGHIGPAPQYYIEETFLARVAEVVGYVHEAGLKAIINIHHDGASGNDGAGKVRDEGWLSINAAGESPEGMSRVSAQFERVWTQIAEYFRDYGDYLMFESMNEVHDGNWGWSPEPVQRPHYGIVNSWNQIFVNAVRAAGGNNRRRVLIVPGLCAAPRFTAAGFFKLPEDGGSEKNRLAVAVHYYDPYEFGIAATRQDWGSAEDRRKVDEDFRVLTEAFIAKGVPVIIGESGAVRQKGGEAVRLDYIGYVYRKAHEAGLIPLYWDNGAFEYGGGEKFGLINRETGEPFSEEAAAVVNVMIDAAL